MKNKVKIIILIMVIPSLYILNRIIFYFNIIFSKKRASAIGIIGGADGPTAIFIAKKAGIDFLLPSFIFIIIVSLIIIIVLKKKYSN